MCLLVRSKSEIPYALTLLRGKNRLEDKLGNRREGGNLPQTRMAVRRVTYCLSVLPLRQVSYESTFSQDVFGGFHLAWVLWRGKGMSSAW